MKKSIFLLSGVFRENNNNSIFEKENFIFDDPTNEKSWIYLGAKKDFNVEKLISTLRYIMSNNKREYKLDASSFTSLKVNEDDVVRNFIYVWHEFYGKEFNLKSKKESKERIHIKTKKDLNNYKVDHLIASQMCEIKMLQNTAPNILTINKFVSYIKNLVTQNKSLKLTILSKKELEKLGMNLILGVNSGSNEEIKVAILEYTGAPKLKQKITFVGKGIMFDSGGYNLKTPVKYMIDMKFDMSGAAISVHLVDTLSKLKIKNNVSCIVPLTDNMIDSKAQLPESIWTSMSGKTVEVANTDAEGRLILADAITYAAKVMKSSLIVDIATLTGAVFYALGSKYTGAWATNDKHWELLKKSAKNSNEKIWRLPLDDEYIENLSKNTFADTQSCFNVASPDSSVAATWLKQFALGKEFIHLDIASSGESNSKGQAPMFRTLIDFVKSIK